MIEWVRSLDRNEVTYWSGLLLLFVGVGLSVSVATALMVVGGVLTVESVITSYLATWISEKRV